MPRSAPRPPSPPSPLVALLRDLRDATGAGVLAGGIFGLPVLLAAMGGPLDTTTVQVQARPDAPREAVYLAALPLPAPPEDPVGDDPAGADVADPTPDEPPVAAAPEPAPVPRPAAPEPQSEPEPQPEPAAPTPEALAAATPAPEASPEAPQDAPQDAAAPDAPTELGAPGLRGPRVRVDASGKRQWVALRGTPELEALHQSKERSEQRQKRRRCEDGTEQIRATGEGQYEVARDLVDYYVKDLEEAARLASVAWHRGPDGKRDGFRIRRIRCGNVLHQAGFRNGDVVHSVNGKKIRTVLHALGAYRKLKRKEHLKIEVTGRDGETRRLRYRIS